MARIARSVASRRARIGRPLGAPVSSAHRVARSAGRWRSRPTARAVEYSIGPGVIAWRRKAAIRSSRSPLAFRASGIAELETVPNPKRSPALRCWASAHSPARRGCRTLESSPPNSRADNRLEQFATAWREPGLRRGEERGPQFGLVVVLVLELLLEPPFRTSRPRTTTSTRTIYAGSPRAKLVNSPHADHPAIDLKDGCACAWCAARRRRGPCFPTIGRSRPALAQRGAEYLHVVDLDGAFEGEPAQFGMVVQIARETAFGPRSARHPHARHGDALPERGPRPRDHRRARSNRGVAGEAVRGIPGRIAAGVDARGAAWPSAAGWRPPRSPPGTRARLTASVARVIFTDISTDGTLAGRRSRHARLRRSVRCR